MNNTQYIAKEFKLKCLRETPLPASLAHCNTATEAAEYWRMTVEKADWFRPSAECFVVLMLNARRKVTGHSMISMGTKDSIMIHPGECFRLAILANASAVILMHNHPSGESTPSPADIRVTRDLIRAGQLLKIEVLDHVIVGIGEQSSLRELGFFY